MRKAGQNDANAYSIFHNAIRKCDEESRRILNRIFYGQTYFQGGLEDLLKAISFNQK